MELLVKGGIAFVALFLLDFVWAKYTIAMTEGRAVYSGVLATAIIALSLAQPLLLTLTIPGY